MATTGRNPGNPAKKRKKPATHTHVITTSAGNVRITEPANLSAKKGKSGITVLVGEQAQQLNPVSGFLGFLRERAVVGVAIAFIVASQMQVFAKALVDEMITPAFQLVFGGQELPKRVFSLHWHDRTETFHWGSVLYSFINFLFIIAALYFILRFLKLDKLDKPEKKKT